METRYFVAQDTTGERRRVQVLAPEQQGQDAAGYRYALEDGSAVRRVDNETFQIVGSGAYVTLVRE